MSDLLEKIKNKFLPGRTGKNAKVSNYFNFFLDCRPIPLKGCCFCRK